MRRYLLMSSILGMVSGAMAAEQAGTASTQVITPGHGSLTDAAGNVWTITSSGSIREGDQWTPGGGGTSRLAIINGVVYGEDSSGKGWFDLSSNGQYWTNTPPPPAIVATGATPATPHQADTSSPSVNSPTQIVAPPQPLPSDPVQLGLDAQYGCSTSVPNSPSSHGGFGTVNGQILQPNGTPFIARGINIRSNELGDILNGAVLAKFPGINFVRINIRSLDNPASLAPAVNYLTSKGIVAELEDHPDGGGGQDSWASQPGDVGWYGQAAAYFKDNPYVWFGTFNEPATDNLSGWHKATYDVIRGAGNTAPILIEPGGSRPGNLLNALDLSVYTKMENIVGDPHVYGYQNGFSSDSGSLAANARGMISAMQKMQSLDGPVPVIIGEYGDSTDGSNTDPNGMGNVQAVINSGVGSAAWSWISGGSDMLQSGGNLTPFGTKVAGFIKNSGAQGCNISPIASLVPTNKTINALAAQPASLVPQNSLANIQPPAGMN